MQIVSWNVNGLRAVCKKGFSAWLEASNIDVLGIQEAKLSSVDQIPAEIQDLTGWDTYFSIAKRGGYSGTGLFCRKKPLSFTDSLGVAEFDDEARFQQAEWNDFFLINAYFPKGSGSAHDNSRVPFKLAFYQQVFERVQQLRQTSKEVIIMGDFNTAHREMDLKNWRANQKASGFLPEERAVLDAWQAAGLLDTFRVHHPEQPDVYTWWSPWAGARKRNVGWRVDYVFASQGLLPRITSAFVWPEVMGSDHCPVGIDVR